MLNFVKTMVMCLLLGITCSAQANVMDNVRALNPNISSKVKSNDDGTTTTMMNVYETTGLDCYLRLGLYQRGDRKTVDLKLYRQAAKWAFYNGIDVYGAGRTLKLRPKVIPKRVSDKEGIVEYFWVSLTEEQLEFMKSAAVITVLSEKGMNYNVDFRKVEKASLNYMDALDMCQKFLRE